MARSALGSRNVRPPFEQFRRQSRRNHRRLGVERTLRHFEARGILAGQHREGVLELRALQRNALFAAAAFPWRVSQPLMNRYAPGMEYGPHVDNSLMGGNEPLRTDMSGTLFLSEPTDYDGGELIVESSAGRQAVKLPAGDLFLYSSTRVHYVAPVTRGARLGVVFWIQSLVRDHDQRGLLFEISQTLSVLQQQRGQTPEIIQLTACYHRLVQMWAQP